MAKPRQSIAVGALTILVVLAGCLSASGAGQPASATSTPTDGPASPTGTESPTPTSTTTRPPTATPATTTTACPRWVSFYGLGGPGETAWEPDRVAIGYTVPGNASVFFVAFEDQTVLGATHVTTRDVEYGVTADGDGIPLDRPLNGSHVIRVAAYADSNGNGQFDVGTDAPCRHEGEPVEAGPRRIDFSAFTDDGTPSTSPSQTD